MKNNPPGMSLIVKTITRLTLGLIFIYGVCITLEGHSGPGGGFAGGIIIALSFVQLVLAFGREAVLKNINQEKGISLMSLGGLIILFTSTLGSGEGKIPPYLSDIAVSVIVGIGLFTVFLVLVAFKADKE